MQGASHIGLQGFGHKLRDRGTQGATHDDSPGVGALQVSSVPSVLSKGLGVPGAGVPEASSGTGPTVPSLCQGQMYLGPSQVLRGPCQFLQGQCKVAQGVGPCPSSLGTADAQGVGSCQPSAGAQGVGSCQSSAGAQGVGSCQVHKA